MSDALNAAFGIDSGPFGCISVLAIIVMEDRNHGDLNNLTNRIAVISSFTLATCTRVHVDSFHLFSQISLSLSLSLGEGEVE